MTIHQAVWVDGVVLPVWAGSRREWTYGEIGIIAGAPGVGMEFSPVAVQRGGQAAIVPQLPTGGLWNAGGLGGSWVLGLAPGAEMDLQMYPLVSAVGIAGTPPARQCELTVVQE